MITGSPTWISNHTADDAANITITSGIDSTYSAYLLVMTDMHCHGATHTVAFNDDHSATDYDNPHCSTNILFQYNDDDSGASFSQMGGILWDNHTTPVEMTRRIGNGSSSCMNCIFIFLILLLQPRKRNTCGMQAPIPMRMMALWELGIMQK